MPENPLEVRLEATDQRPGHFTLTFNSSQYPVTLNPEANVTFSDWLRRLRPVLAGQSDPSGELTQEVLLRNVGTWLWQALVPASAPAEQRDALAQALRSGCTPLLLALPDKLTVLPWELLCDPEQPAEQGFLGRRRPLIRFTPSDTPVPAIQPPLRVLLLISSPPSLKEDSRVDVESERAAVEQATCEMREAGLLYLLVEDIVTPKRVQQVLMRFKPHIVHYIGHGGYYEKTGGVLLWEDERGDISSISDVRLADILRPRNLHAVILHACETGRSNARTDVHGIAGTLVKEGIPAVLAQQANFTYESSQCASEAWYTALTAGQGFAEALFEVRQALSLADRPDWAVPILQGNAASLAPVLDASAPPSSPDPLLINQGAAADLPTPTGVFVGRHRELRALRLMLENAPGSGPVLALITGPGGVGKSTLAAQAVTRYGAKYKATLTLSCLGYQSVELFLQRIGEFLKRHEAPSFLEQTLPDPKLSTTAKIEEAIAVLNQTGPFLLVVDNLESVQENQTLRDESLLQLLQKLLTNLRGGRVLITGRYAVKNLLPAGKFAAHLLWLDLDDLSPYETNQLLTRHPTLAHLGETVRQILIDEFGGLPYVYDLLSSDAASQSLDLLIHDVQGRITQERKQRSTQEWQEVRQQVVEFVALEATVNRLSEPSRTLLARLGVLHRPFPLIAIEQGLGAARSEWQPLLDWSLLRYDPLERSYRLHSITRHYVEDLPMDEQDRRQTQAKLAAWYEHYTKYESHDLAGYLEAHRLWRASGDARQAGELVMQIAEPLRRFGLYPLLRELCMTMLTDIGEGNERLVASIRGELGNLASLQGNYEEAREFYKQSLEITERLGDQSGRATSLHNLGILAQDQGNYEEARGLYEQSLQIRERLGDQQGRASSLHQLGMIAQDQGKYEEARELYEQSQEIFEQLGNQSGRASSLHQLGMIAQDQGNYEEARELYQQSLQIDEQLGDQSGRASSLYQLGALAYKLGDFENALKYTIQAFILFHALPSPSRINAQQLIASIRSQMDEATFAGHWRALAGDLPLPDFSPEDANQQIMQTLPNSASGSASQQIMQTLVDLIQAPTWEESKRILESHPELLQPEIDVTLQEWAMQQENESARESIEEYRVLLARCRDMGVDVAFAELQGEKSADAAFASALNRICGEVVVTLRAGNAERQKVLATQIERMLKEDLPIEGARDFLQVLVIWLHGQDTQALVEKLQPVFRNAYDQMVVAVEQEETDNTDEEGALKIEDLPGLVSSTLLQGTVEQRQQMAEELIKAQQQVPPEQASLGNFFGCLATALRGETPEVASLEAPFTDLWQEFQDALATPSGEQDQQQEAKHD